MGIKASMKRIGIICAKKCMSVIYAVMKTTKVQDKVCMISRESNDIPFEFAMIADELHRRGITTDIHAMRLDKNYVEYIIELIKQMKALASSKLVLIDTYSIPVSVLKHRKELTVIQMWHALAAIKKFGWQTVGHEDGSSELVAEAMNMHGGYDYILCASKATAKSFGQAFKQPESKMLSIGLPRIDRIIEENPETTKLIRKKYNKDGKKIILYAPTFRKNRPVEWKALAEAVDRDRYNLVMKLHPLDAVTVESDIEGVYCDMQFNTYDLLKAADYVISDYSSFVVEASLTLKPLYLWVYDIDEYREKVGLNMDFFNETIGSYVFRDPEEMMNALEKPYDTDAVTAFRNKYIEVNTHNCTGQLVDFIEKLVRD